MQGRWSVGGGEDDDVQRQQGLNWKFCGDFLGCLGGVPSRKAHEGWPRLCDLPVTDVEGEDE